jgi:hypothetical protein
MYRVSVLDPEGIVANSVTADSLAGTAKLVIGLAGCIGDEWTKPLLDADGELTIEVKGAGERDLTETEKTDLAALVAELGANPVSSDGDGSRWSLG